MNSLCWTDFLVNFASLPLFIVTFYRPDFKDLLVHLVDLIFVRVNFAVQSSVLLDGSASFNYLWSIESNFFSIVFLLMRYSSFFSMFSCSFRTFNSHIFFFHLPFSLGINKILLWIHRLDHGSSVLCSSKDNVLLISLTLSLSLSFTCNFLYICLAENLEWAQVWLSINVMNEMRCHINVC